MEEILLEDTNFQKASCAIDASVQIYSSRVDDVWTSSYRVLENLNRRECKGGCSIIGVDVHDLAVG